MSAQAEASADGARVKEAEGRRGDGRCGRKDEVEEEPDASGRERQEESPLER